MALIVVSLGIIGTLSVAALALVVLQERKLAELEAAIHQMAVLHSKQARVNTLAADIVKLHGEQIEHLVMGSAAASGAASGAVVGSTGDSDSDTWLERLRRSIKMQSH